MAYKKNDGPPPLEDPNSPDYVCIICQNNIDALCHECQEIADLKAIFTRMKRDNSDRDRPLDVDDESQSYVGHMTLHENPESPVTTRPNTPQPMSESDTSDCNATYNTDTIINSPTSTDTTLDLNEIENVNETSTEARNVSDSKISSERPDVSVFCASCSNLNKTCTGARARNVMLWVDATKDFKFKPLILDDKFERDNDNDTDPEMPPLEKTKKNKEDSDENNDDPPPLEEI